MDDVTKVGATATIDRKDLADAIRVCSMIVDGKIRIPILDNVHMRSMIGGMQFVATDLDLTCKVNVNGLASQHFDVTVPVKAINKIVAKTDAPVASMTMNVESLTVDCGVQVFLHTLPVEDYPQLGKIEWDHSFQIPACDLHRALSKTKHCISDEMTRYYLNGIYMHPSAGEDPKLLFVATDGHRMSKVTVSSLHVPKDLPGVILPTKFVKVVLALLGKKPDESPISMAISKDGIKASVVIGNVTLVTKCIDGSFPVYDRVIPWKNDKRLLLNRVALMKNIDAVAAVAADKGIYALKVEIAGSEVALSMTNPDLGTVRKAMEGEWDQDAPMTLGFNYAYLRSLCEASDSEIVQLRIMDAGTPAIVAGEGEPELLQVLMPCRAV